MPQPGSLASLRPQRSPEAVIAAALGDLQRQVDELKTARSLAYSSVDSGSTQVTAGEIQVLNGSGVILCRIGTDPVTGYTGFRAYLPDGTLVIASEDPVYGGMMRPWLPMRLASVNITDTTTSGSYVTLQQGFCVRTHGAVQWDGLVQSSSAGTTGNVRLIDAASDVIGTLSVPPNATTRVTIGPVAWPSGSWTPDDGTDLFLQAQRTGGAGTIGVQTLGLHGVGSA